MPATRPSRLRLVKLVGLKKSLQRREHALIHSAYCRSQSSNRPCVGREYRKQLVGAVFFYVSDIFVANQRFVIEQFYNRLIGLPLYYTAQFLLAFSVGLVKRPETENRGAHKK